VKKIVIFPEKIEMSSHIIYIFKTLHPNELGRLRIKDHGVFSANVARSFNHLKIDWQQIHQIQI
jgi:hypothetical protein